jgi:hypothetical protein
MWQSATRAPVRAFVSRLPIGRQIMAFQQVFGKSRKN